MISMSSGNAIDSAYEKISMREKLAYGSGDIATNLIGNFITAYISYFYSKALGMSTEMTGIIFLLSGIFDGVSDILMGIIIDKTRSRHGKARSWILWLAVPFAISAVLMMLVPRGWSRTAQGMYIFITYNLTTTVFSTAITLPYGVLNSLITRDRDQRAMLNIARMVMAAMGVLIVSIATMPLVNSMGGTQKAWVIVVSIYAVIAAVLYFVCFIGTKERVTAEVTGQHDNIPALKALGSIIKNRYWWMILILSIVDGVGSSIGSTVNVFYTDYILGDSNLMSFLAILMTVPAMAALPFATLCIRKKGKRNTMLIGQIMSFIVCSLRLIAPANIPYLFTMIALKGAAVAFTSMVIHAMLADTIEYGQWKTGVRVEGITYSASSMSNKVAGGVGSATVGLLLGLAAFDGSLAAQPKTALNMIQGLFLYPSIIVSGIIIVILCFYDLDKRYPAIMEELQKRTAKETTE